MNGVHTAVLLTELGAVILGLGLLGRLARWLRVSPIPLYLLAGLAFGTGGVLPLSESEEFISVGSQIGVVLLLLTIGLEYTASELVDNLHTHKTSGIVDALANGIPGAVAALLLGWGPVAALALAGITWVSSSGIISKVLTDLGRLGNRETPTVLAVLVLEDLSMAVYLPILTALLVGTGPFGGGLLGGALTVIIALVTIAAAFAVALRASGLVNRIIYSEHNEVLLLSVLGITLLVAGIAQGLKVSDAVGAFLIGIALSGRVSESAQQLLSPLRDLFAAVFFVFFGLQTNPHAIPGVIGPAVALAAVTVVTKTASGAWAARKAGISAVGQMRAGATLVARGEFSIVIAEIAATAGIVAGFKPLATTYVLIMAVIGPLTARFATPAMRKLQAIVEQGAAAALRR
jgi:CPA2 family monovalent cation:H+ antiporter-2